MLAGYFVDDHALRIFLLPVAAGTAGAPETCQGDDEGDHALNDQEEIDLRPPNGNDLENIQTQSC